MADYGESKPRGGRSSPRRQSVESIVARLARFLGSVVAYALLTAGALVMAAPFLWMVSTSLKSAPEVFRLPVQLLPTHIEWSNYVQAIGQANLGRLGLNSGMVAVSTTAAQVFLGSIAAYAFARLQFPGRDSLFFLILMTQMIPFQIAIVPLFVIIKHMPIVGGNDCLAACRKSASVRRAIMVK
jgi:multiple sugar transport system permease protein